MTTELHKGKYVYYRCSYGHGKCDLPYMPEPGLSQLGGILKDIYVPEHVVRAIIDFLCEKNRVLKRWFAASGWSRD